MQPEQEAQSFGRTMYKRGELYLGINWCKSRCYGDFTER